MTAAGRMLREAWVSARAMRGFSVTFAAIGFAVLAALTVTVGQGIAQRDAVRASFADPELRTFILVDEAGGALPWSMAGRAESLSTVDHAWAVGTAVDVRNDAFPHGDPAPARAVTAAWDLLPLELRAGRWPAGPDEAVVDTVTARQLGIRDGAGAVAAGSGRSWSVVGVYAPGHGRAPSGVLHPPGAGVPRAVHVTVVDVRDLDTVVDAVVALSDSAGPGELRVDRSAGIAALRESVAGVVDAHGTAITLGVMAGSTLVLGLASLLMVNARRQEFGRRRALGATRLMIVSLVVVQGFMVIAPASVLGGAAAVAYLWLREAVLVPVGFTAPTVLAASLGGVAAQLPSAVAAGLRDPVRVLRRP